MVSAPMDPETLAALRWAFERFIWGGCIAITAWVLAAAGLYAWRRRGGMASYRVGRIVL